MMEGRGQTRQRVKDSKDCKRVQSSFSSSVTFWWSQATKIVKNASSEAEEEKVFRPPQLELSKLQT